MLKNGELEEDIYFLKTNLVSSLPFGFKQPLKAFAVDQCGQGKQLQIVLLRLRKTFFLMTFKHFSYRAFHRFGQPKFDDGGSILGSSQFTLLPQLP